jgi:hypothetical protein
VVQNLLQAAERHPATRHDTFNRVFQALDPNAFLDCFLRWTEALRTILAGKVVAVDGKALRRALAKAKGSSLPYIVSAWAARNSLVLGQVKWSAVTTCSAWALMC